MAGGAAGTQGLGAAPSQPTGTPSGVNFNAVRNDTTMGDTFRGTAPQSQQTFGQRMSSFMPGAFGMSAGAPQPPQAQQTAPTFQPPAPTFQPPAPTFPAYQQPAPTFQPPPPQMRNAYVSPEEMAAQQGGLQALQQALRGKGVDLGYQPSVDAIPYPAPAPAPAPVAPAMRPTPVAPPSQVEMANARQQARAQMANRRGSKVAPMPAVRSTPIR